MRCNWRLFSSPRQYAAADRISLNAGIRLVVGTCGPRHRSVHATVPSRVTLSYIVNPPAPTSTDAPSAASSTSPVLDFSPINSSLYGRSEEHTSELQSRFDLVCRLLLA